MFRTLPLRLVVLFSTALVASTASAFNELGHYVVGKVTFDCLTEAQRDGVHNILKSHPHYAEYLSAGAPPNVELREWVFLRAGAWSDWIRSHHTSDYHKGPWHYINHAYRPGMTATSTLPAPLPQEQNILERLPKVAQAVKSSASNELGLLESLSPDQRRAVAVCWLFHLVGDLHQPLHSATLVSDRFPEGDRGGNELAVVTSGSRPLRLHAYWDGALGTNASYENVAAIVKSFADDPPTPFDELAALVAQADYHHWALESYNLAIEYVYLNGELPVAPWQPAYGAADAVAGPEVPVLKESVKENARKVSRQRLQLAGQRLARQLTLLLP